MAHEHRTVSCMCRLDKLMDILSGSCRALSVWNCPGIANIFTIDVLYPEMLIYFIIIKMVTYNTLNNSYLLNRLPKPN